MSLYFPCDSNGPE